MVVHLPDGRAGIVAAGSAGGATLADHGGGDVRSLEQWAGHRACRAWLDLVHADGDDRGAILSLCAPRRRGRLGPALSAAQAAHVERPKETQMATKKYETVLIEKQDGITWLIMNRPEKRNAMSP